MPAKSNIEQLAFIGKTRTTSEMSIDLKTKKKVCESQRAYHPSDNLEKKMQVESRTHFKKRSLI